MGYRRNKGVKYTPSHFERRERMKPYSQESRKFEMLSEVMMMECNGNIFQSCTAQQYLTLRALQKVYGDAIISTDAIQMAEIFPFK